MNIDDFLQTPVPNPDPDPGMMLLSAPMMTDSFFSRTAVLLLPGDDKGKMGLILNHELPLSLNEITGNVFPDVDVPIFNGGPVELERMFFLHTVGADLRGSIEVIPGLYVGGETMQVVDFLNSGEPTEGRIRFFLGYSGWGKDQLTKEILEKSWTVNPAPTAEGILTGSGEKYWRRQVTLLGDSHRSWLSMPHHPSLN